MSKREALVGGILVPDLAYPRPQDVDVAFMAYRMRTIVRFFGHPMALTLREHQDLCGLLAEVHEEGAAVVEWARHHDHHEFATGDVTTPLQRTIDARCLADVQERWDVAICAALGLDVPSDHTRDRVAVFDRLALCLEWRFMLGMDLDVLGTGLRDRDVDPFRELVEVVVTDQRRQTMRHGRLLLSK